VRTLAMGVMVASTPVICDGHALVASSDDNVPDGGDVPASDDGADIDDAPLLNLLHCPGGESLEPTLNATVHNASTSTAGARAPVEVSTPMGRRKLTGSVPGKYKGSMTCANCSRQVARCVMARHLKTKVCRAHRGG
jgi:hypothetical protein